MISVHIKVLTWRKESYGVYNLNVSKTDVEINHFFLYSNCIILLDNTNKSETIYITKRFKANKYTKTLKKFAFIFDFSKEAIDQLSLGKQIYFWNFIWNYLDSE